MFTMQLKTKLVILTILFTLLFNTFLFAECDMMAMIAKKGHSIAWINGSESSWETPNDPHDYFKFLYDRSPYNPDGYGIIYIDYDGYIPEINYPDVIGYPTLFNDVSNQAWYVIPNETMGNYTISMYDGPYENAKSEILESSNGVGVVLGHVRNATGTAIGNHPFQIICDVNDDGIDETFMFMHNGNVTNMVSAFRADIIEMYGLEWFTTNQSNWKGDPNSPDDWIDSEMYFHYLIAHVKNANGNVMKGILNALGNINREYEPGTTINTGMYDNNVNANFVMTDEENLYLYRNCDNTNYTLAFDEYDSGFWGVQTSNTHGQFEQMAENSFVIISPYGTPTVMNNFLFPDIYYNYPVYCSYNQYNFISGEIDNNIQDLNIYYRKTYISGNEDYTSAEQTLQQIIADYPLAEEAGIAVYYLYHLEGLTDQDFGELISYLENLSPESDTSLEKARENVLTKSYMKEKEYLTAIDRLETIITNSQIPDEVIAAMIDEGYCYLELAEEELKASPSNCTVRTSTLEEYQAMVNELKHSFSFYAEETDHEVLHVSGNILSLHNFPNPFNCNTQIAFTLTSASDVSIIIYNVKGQRVKQLMKSRVDAGSHTVTWNGININNVESAPGIYFYKITAGGDSIVKKMFLIK